MEKAPSVSRPESPHHPLHIRALGSIGVWLGQRLFSAYMFYQRNFTSRNPGLPTPLIKQYPMRPNLPNRMFLPPNMVQGVKYPLFIYIHGGGWAWGEPAVDDWLCYAMTKSSKMVVVAVSYRKAPRYRFPCAVEDVAALADAIIKDPELNIDERRVAIGGWSAGGNFAFAACQTKVLRGRISACVAWKPVLDFTESVEVKIARRPIDALDDPLSFNSKFMDWLYVPREMDKRDPMISPLFARKEDLPENVYLVGAEYDMLCHEALRLAERLGCESGKERIEIEEVEGGGVGFRQGGVRWEMVPREDHMNEYIVVDGKVTLKTPGWGEDRLSRIGSWLIREVWGIVTDVEEEM